MLIKDSVNIPRLEAGEKRDEHRQEIADTVVNTTRLEVTDYENSPTNPLRQWGNAMSTAAFEEKLRPILPHFIRMLDHPSKPSKRCMGFVIPFTGGGLEHLLTYEQPFMPEHSIMQEAFDDVPDMSVDNISGKDMPAAKWVDGKWEYDTSGGPLPGYKRVRRVDVEAVRGWRTVLLKLISFEVITPAQAERVFGADNRREWADKTGKQSAPTVW